MFESRVKEIEELIERGTDIACGQAATKVRSLANLISDDVVEQLMDSGHWSALNSILHSQEPGKDFNVVIEALEIVKAAI